MCAHSNICTCASESTISHTRTTCMCLCCEAQRKEFHVRVFRQNVVYGCGAICVVFSGWVMGLRVELRKGSNNVYTSFCLCFNCTRHVHAIARLTRSLEFVGQCSRIRTIRFRWRNGITCGTHTLRTRAAYWTGSFGKFNTPQGDGNWRERFDGCFFRLTFTNIYCSISAAT